MEPPYKIWLAQTRVAREVGPCGDARVFGTSKALSLRKLCGVTGRRGRRPLRRYAGRGSLRVSIPTKGRVFWSRRGRWLIRSWLEVVFFGDMVTFAITGARSAPLRRCVSFRDDEGVVSREKIRIFGSSRTSSPTEICVEAELHGSPYGD